MKNIFFFTFLCSFLAFPSFASAQTNQVTLTTYYPAPFGAYARMRLVPQADLNGLCDDGSLYFKNSTGTLQLCTGSAWSDFAGGYWNKTLITNASNPNYDPYTTADIDTYYLNGGDYSNLAVRKPYIGIGTSAPRNMLHILVDDPGTPSALVLENKDVHTPYNPGSPGPGANISFRGETTAPETYKEYVGIRAVYEDVSINRKSYLSFWLVDGAGTGIAEKIRFSGNGFVGILDDSPDANLEIANTVNSQPYFLVSSSSSEGTNGDVFSILTNGKVGINQPTPTEKLEVVGNIKATTLILTSDADLKKDIVPVHNALDKISRLNGVSFEWKDNAVDTKQHMGVIAQDVEKVFPDVVYGTDGHKGVDYPSLIAPLIEAIKELKTQNESLNKKLEQQRTQIYKQQERINSLENVLGTE